MSPTCPPRAANLQAGKILATTIDSSTGDGHRGFCDPAWLRHEPQGRAGTLANSYFEAVEMVKTDPAKSYEIMGAAVKQTGEAFAQSPRPNCAGGTRRRTRSSFFAANCSNS